MIDTPSNLAAVTGLWNAAWKIFESLEDSHYEHVKESYRLTLLSGIAVYAEHFNIAGEWIRRANRGFAE